MFKLNFRNVKIGGKYGLILFVIILLFTASTGVSSYFVHKIGKDVDELKGQGDQAIVITHIQALIRSMEFEMVYYVHTKDNDLIDDFKDNYKTFQKEAKIVRKGITNDKALQSFDQVTAGGEALDNMFNQQIVDAIQRDDGRSAIQFLAKANQIGATTTDILNDLRVSVNQDRNQAIERTVNMKNMTLYVAIISMVLSIIIGGVLVFLVSRRIARRLNRIVRISDQIAEGDLTVESIHYQGTDEIALLSASINKMSGNLLNLVKEVSTVSRTVTGQSGELEQSANEVKAGAEQIAVTMQELATGSETQANSAGELSQAMDQFTQKVKDANQKGMLTEQASTEIVSMSQEGAKLMHESGQQMAKIDQIVQDAVTKVQGLDSSSKEISTLIGTIRDIADQTNLLALNAAIEAARAGEDGKGFAVVADEVRKLAEQVSISVTDITSIIDNIRQDTTLVTESLQNGYVEVEKGTKQIKTTGETFDGINMFISEMVQSIKSVSTDLTDIVAKSEQMNASIEEIASISEESAAGVEETSASSEQTSSSMEEVAETSRKLTKLSERLDQLVHRFEI